MAEKGYKKLIVWQKANELAYRVYLETKKFPKDEIYGMTSHLRRAVISIPSNIAEGFRRKHSKEFKQFLNIALGSCAELETQAVVARELKYIDENREKELTELIDYICRMSANLYKKL